MRGLPVSVLRHEIPGWADISHFVRGEIVAMDFARYRQPLNHVGKSLFTESYSFDEAHAVAGAGTRVSGEFSHVDCLSMRQILVKLDLEHTGRVPLPKFYQSDFDTEWRFGLSEERLRALGALDESGTVHHLELPSVARETVRLHSRLFSQWLHYTFPRDCPFPHKIGTTVTSAVEEFNGYADERKCLALQRHPTTMAVSFCNRYFRMDVFVERRG